MALDKLSTLKVLLNINGSDEDASLNVFLSLAEQKVLNRLYPYDEITDETVVPERYAYVQVQIAQYLYLKQGAEGELNHEENGVNRRYGDDDVPASIMRKITPLGRFV